MPALTANINVLRDLRFTGPLVPAVHPVPEIPSSSLLDRMSTA
jgi:hypothetical protein